MRSRIPFILIWCFFAISSCSTSEDGFDISPTNSSFNLIPLGYEGEASSRSDELALQTLSYYILDGESQIVADVKQVNNESLISVEQLLDGDYFLMVLAEKADVKSPDVEVHPLNRVGDRWLTIDPSKPIQNELFYAKHPFRVDNGLVDQSDVFLKRVVARLDFDILLNGYVDGYIDSIVMIPDDPHDLSTIFNSNNSYAGSASIGAVSLKNNRTILLLADENSEKFTGKVRIVLDASNNKTTVYNYTFSTQLNPNKLSVVTIDATQINGGMGTIFVKKDGFNESSIDYMLQDDEPKEVYTARKFSIHKPIQMVIAEDNELNVRFYSPVGISDVKIMGKLRGLEKRIVIADIEYLPAFAEINIPLVLAQRKSAYLTESGDYFEIPKYDNFSEDHIQFEVVTPDPYMAKVKQFRARWSVTYGLYGGNPELPNGGPAGNWMGIRPIHCREAVAILTNVAYMATLEDFEAHLYTFQGRIMGNGGTGDTLDLKTVIPLLEGRDRFVVGLVYPGNGVIGLGGGATLGAYQNSFLNHYTSTYACNTIFHELGHCMGFNHSSGMTYGPWAEECAGTFYVNNLSRLPVNSASYLNSNSNPTKY